MTAIIWDASAVSRGLDEISGCREQLLIDLKQLLDEFNQWNRPIRYYDILAGDWLEHFAHITYAAVIEVLENGAGDEKPISVPVTSDIHEYDTLRRQPSALQSHLLRAVSKLLAGDSPENWLFSASAVEIGTGGSLKLAERALRAISTKQADLLLVAPYFKCSRIQVVSTLIGWSNWVAMDNLQYPVAFSVSINRGWRTEKSSEKCPAGDLLSILRALLPLHLPVALLEGLAFYREAVLSLPVCQPKALYSASALHSNLTFKLLAAEWCEAGTKLLYHQHGGGYGIDKVHAVEDYEVRVSDRYYTWGWKKALNPNVLPISPATPKYFSRKKRHVLLNCLDYPVVVYRLHFQPMPGTLSTMRQETCEFLKAFAGGISLLVRPYPSDYSGMFEGMLHKAAPDADFDDRGTSVFQRYAQSRLVVHNYLGTGYLETLALNIPTVCFYDPVAYAFRDDAIPIMRELENVGILHRSGKAAARFVDGIIGDPAGWWAQGEVRAARDRFVAQYANFSPDWKSQWKQEFRQVIDEP